MRKLHAASLSVLASFLLMACQSDGNAPPANRAAADARLAQSSAEASTARTGPVLALLTANLKPAFDELDAAKLEAALASDFRRAQMVDGERAVVQSRAEVMAEAAKWRKGAAPGRDLGYAVQEASLSDDGREATVVAIATYKTKYFAPRMLEVLKFRQEAGGWKLARQAQQPLYPGNPRLHAVTIIRAGMPRGTEDISDYLARLDRDAPAVGVDAVIDGLERNPTRGSDGLLYFTVPILFKEPPAPGSRVSAEWVLKECTGGIYRGPFFDFQVSSPNLYFAPAGWARPRCGGSPTAMEVLVRVDGVTVGSTTLRP